MVLKIELKPNERIILGGCAVTNSGPRTRLVIDGKVPVLREKDIMTPAGANTLAKRIYLAVQLMYTSQDPAPHHASYARLVRDMLLAAPAARSLIDNINNRILTGDLYKALKEARKLIAYERERPDMHHASNAYAKVATETASPRELEATLLLKAAARLQAVQDKPAALNDALMYNRRLWTVFIDAVMKEDNGLPVAVRNNLTKLGMVVMDQTFALMTKPKPRHLQRIIKINRSIATGLRAKAQ